MLLWTARGLACGLALGLAPVLATGIELDRLKVGDRISDRIQYGRRTHLVLPKGDWQLAVKREYRTASDIDMVDLFFHEIVDNTLTRTVYLTTNKYTGPGWNMWLDEPCKSKGDSYWLEDRKSSMQDAFCIRVGFLTGVVNGASGDQWESWARSIKESGVAYSPEMPFVRVVRFTRSEYLSMRMAFNPAVSGLPASTTSERKFSPWHPESREPGTGRRAFYEALRLWAPRFATAVDAMFRLERVQSDSFEAPVLPRSDPAQVPVPPAGG